MKKRLLGVCLFSLSLTLQATNYYVSTAGSNNNDGLSSQSAFQTIQTAANLTVGGDTVYIMNGVYNSISGPILNVTRSGTANAYITFKAYAGHTPKITASGNTWNCVSINGSYIVLEGIELEGANATITYEAALASYNSAAAGGTNWSYYAHYNTNGISIGGPRTESKLPHHLVIRNCKVHDFPGGGISSIQADYTTIENNLVYNNAWYMMYAGSGISILTPINSDRTRGYKNFIRNNICHTNKTTVPWVSLKRLSDGNGIIIDVNQHGYNDQGSTATDTVNAFTGRTLVENNLCINNGGSGIHAFKADHVEIINNTAYHNGTVVGYADIYAGSSKDVNIINNIMYSRDGGKCNTNSGNTNVVYNYNNYWNGTVTVVGANDFVADPLFRNLSIDRLTGDFRLQTTSPALNSGSNITGQYSLKDIVGILRPQGTKPDRGAYEAIILGVESLPLQDKTSVFPNPVDDILSIRLPTQNDNMQVQIWDSTGRLMLKQMIKAQTNEVNVKHLSVGSYMALIYQNSQKVAVHKFVKL